MCNARKTEHHSHRQEENTSTMCHVMPPAVLRTENTREGVTSASVVLSKKLCVENQIKPQTQTQLPSCFGQCKSPGGFQWQSEEAVAGTRTMGGLSTLGKKHSCVNCSTVKVLQLPWLSLP